MRGIERRSYGPGRRLNDRSGRRSWERPLLLFLALVLLAGLLFAAQGEGRPRREAQALRGEVLMLDARLHAAAVEAAVNRLRAGLDAAERVLAAQPGSTVEALDQARRTAGDAALSLTGPDGQVLAAVGKPGAAPGQGDLVIHDGQAWLRRPLADGRSLIARASLPPPAPRTPGAILELTPVAALPDDLLRGQRPAHLQGDMLKSAAALSGGAYAVTATARSPGGARAWLDDARLLAAPLVLAFLMLAALVFLTWRQDRTARRWAETERRFRVAVEAARCGVWEWDLAADRIVLSDYMAALLELPAGAVVSTEELIGRIHPRYRDLFEQALARAERDGRFEIAFPVPLPGGGVRWIDARGRSREERRDGRYVSLLGVALDITEARRAKARAQAAESRLMDGIQSVSDAFVLFDRQGRLLLWNQAFQDTFAFPPGVLQRGAPKAELNRIAAQAIRTDQASASGRPGVREVELKDGRWLQMAERYTGDGGVVVICADITVLRRQEAERRQTADNLRQTVEELEASRTSLALLARKYEAAMTRAEAANQAKSEFLANMSHELRTPLNAINGFSEIMAGEMFGPLGDPRYKGYAQDIHNSGQHLLSLINDILDMAKIEAGKLTLHYERFDLADLGRQVIRLMRGKAEEAGLSLSLDAPDGLPVEADLRGLKQVLLNLISNAVKFTPRDGQVVVSLRHIPGEERVRVAVRDTGIGIAPEDVGRLAQPFVQVENQHAKTTQGTGLGLALTKSLIELHGGRMTIESEPGDGALVWFDLPTRAPAGVLLGTQPARRIQAQAA